MLGLHDALVIQSVDDIDGCAEAGSRMVLNQNAKKSPKSDLSTVLPIIKTEFPLQFYHQKKRARRGSSLELW